MVQSNANRFGMSIEEVLRRNHRSLFGMEGEGDGSDTQSSDGDGSGTTSIKPEEKDPEVFDREYVQTLRHENASRRKNEEDLAARIKKFEEAEAERKKAEMTEVERLKAETEEKDQKIADAEKALITERKRNAVLAEASKLKFQDPEDALAYVDLEGLKMNEDGTPHKTSIESAVKKIAEDKKYLLTGPGSADGGSRGSNPEPEAEKVKRIKEELAARGAVPIPSNTF